MEAEKVEQGGGCQSVAEAYKRGSVGAARSLAPGLMKTKAFLDALHAHFDEMQLKEHGLSDGVVREMHEIFVRAYEELHSAVQKIEKLGDLNLL